MTPSPLRRFEGWTAVVTGASAGLGEAFARRLAPVAGRIVLVARRADRLETLAADLRRLKPGLAADVETADLSRPEETEALVARLEGRGIVPDLLINNAGLGDLGIFDNSEWERTGRMVHVNVEALTRLTHAWLPGMIARKRGAVLNVGSIAGYLPLPTFAVYAASKAYVNSFSEALACEVRGTGVTVTALCPGPILTEFFTVAQRQSGDLRAMTSPAFLRIGVGRAVSAALAGAAKGKSRVVPGFWTGMFSLIMGRLPLWMLRIVSSFEVAAIRKGK